MRTALKLFTAALMLTIVWGSASAQRRAGGRRAPRAPVKEYNNVGGADPRRTLAIVGATQI